MNRKPDWDDVDWVRESASRSHHQALTKYLRGRTQVQKDTADARGLTTAEIMRQGFDVEKGHTAVPQCAIKLLRDPSVAPEVDMSFVISLCRSSREAKAHVRELARVLRKNYDPSALSEEAREIVNEATVREVLES